MSQDYASQFSVHNIPFGVASSNLHSAPQGVTRIGNSVIFLDDCSKRGFLAQIDGLPTGVFAQNTLNSFAAISKHIQRATREALQNAWTSASATSNFPKGSIEDISDVTMHLPFRVGEFIDFSCSLDHVKNAGRIIINDERPPPAFFHLPIGYQGRASSIVVSGTDIYRPMGQYRDRSTESTRDEPKIVFGESKSVDYELEFAAIIGKPLARNKRLRATHADEHIFGFVILNDWSARDIQGFEMIPLGPLNGKNFGTTVSPWIITLDALQPFIVENQKPQVAIPGHLQDPEHATYAIRMQVEILAQGVASTVGASQIQSLYWSARQMIAHVASAGSPLNTGDVMATGTVSGSQPGSFGCLLEVTEGGKIPFKLQDGTERRFLQDGDVVRMTAVAGDDESGVGFGECIGKLLPSLPFK